MNRKVELEVELPRSKDLCDLYFSSGNFIDGELEDLTEDQLDELTNLYPDALCEYGMERGCYD